MERKGKQTARIIGGGWPPSRYTTNGRGKGDLRTELHGASTYLLPVRLLAGLAWLWWYTSHVVEPGWRDGSNLAAYFARQLDDGRVVFPEYRSLIAEVFVPHATVFGWVLLVGQLAIGISLLFGAATNAALLGGIAIHLNLLLAGSVEVSTLAIVVQALLLLSNAGAVFGIDGWLKRTGRLRFFAAVNHTHLSAVVPRAIGVVAALAIVVYGGFHAADWTPAGVFHDPAAMLTVQAGLVAAWSTIGCLRVATPVTTKGSEALTSGSPGWPAGWEPLYGIAGEIDHLGTADLEWSFRSPLPEWSAGNGRRRTG